MDPSNVPNGPAVPFLFHFFPEQDFNFKCNNSKGGHSSKTKTAVKFLIPHQTACFLVESRSTELEDADASLVWPRARPTFCVNRVFPQIDFNGDTHYTNPKGVYGCARPLCTCQSSSCETFAPWASVRTPPLAPVACGGRGVGRRRRARGPYPCAPVPHGVHGSGMPHARSCSCVQPLPWRPLAATATAHTVVDGAVATVAAAGGSRW